MRVEEAVHTTSRVDIRPWPHDPTVAHLVLLDVGMVPTVSDVDTWIDRAVEAAPNDHSIRTIRTGALFPAAAEAFVQRDFVPIDRLILLERRLDPTESMPQVPRLASSPWQRGSGSTGTAPSQRAFRLRRMRARDLDTAADIDIDAFETGWQNDAASLDEIRRATPTAHARVLLNGREPIGFALTGKAGSTGYLQRFAVRSAWQGRGAGRVLVGDALRWLSRRGATNALVNTGIDNDRALRLYESLGFTRRHEHLVVLERRR